MIVVKPDLELKVGRRQTDGTIRLSTLGEELVQISVSYKGERSTKYEISLKSEEQHPGVWDQNDRRTS